MGRWLGAYCYSCCSIAGEKTARPPSVCGLPLRTQRPAFYLPTRSVPHTSTALPMICEQDYPGGMSGLLAQIGAKVTHISKDLARAALPSIGLHRLAETRLITSRRDAWPEARASEPGRTVHQEGPQRIFLGHNDPLT